MTKDIKYLIPDLVAALDKFTNQLADDIKLESERRTPRDTGHAATQWVKEKTDDNIEIKNMTDYLNEPELGNSKQPAQLFTKRSIDIQLNKKRDFE